MSAVLQTRLWVAQRVSAVVLAVTVLVHLATMIYVIHGGLTAAQILSRTRGSVGWLLLYGTFVTAVAVHGPIGLRNVLTEWGVLAPRPAAVLCALFAVLIAVLGWRAVIGLYL